MKYTIFISEISLSLTVLAGCSPSAPPPVEHSSAYYLQHADEDAAAIRDCRAALPARTPADCENAERAGMGIAAHQALDALAHKSAPTMPTPQTPSQ